MEACGGLTGIRNKYKDIPSQITTIKARLKMPPMKYPPEVPVIKRFTSCFWSTLMNNMLVRSASGLAYVIMLACFSGVYGQVFLACFLSVAAVLEWMQFTKSWPCISCRLLLDQFSFIYCFTGTRPDQQLRWLKGLIVLIIFVLMTIFF